MPPTVEFHPLFKTVCKVALLVLAFAMTMRLLAGSRGETPFSDGRIPTEHLRLHSSPDLLLPMVTLDIPEATLETSWSAALAMVLNGRTEVPVEAGRVDVLTDEYAIEVERMSKWHEAVGQASHYALSTGRTPMIALIIASDSWPLSQENKAKIRLIEQTCLSKSIKLVLIRRNAL